MQRQRVKEASACTHSWSQSALMKTFLNLVKDLAMFPDRNAALTTTLTGLWLCCLQQLLLKLLYSFWKCPSHFSWKLTLVCQPCRHLGEYPITDWQLFQKQELYLVPFNAAQLNSQRWNNMHWLPQLHGRKSFLFCSRFFSHFCSMHLA